jgi:hypothetical protein
MRVDRRFLRSARSRQANFVARALGLTLLASALLAPVSTAQSPCDPTLPQPAAPQGYRVRGDRCEGIYIQALAGTTLRLASLTRSFSDFDPTTDHQLRLAWTPLGGAQTHVRASALKHGLYYRMDAVRPAGAASYDWPTDMLKEFQLSKMQLGVLAWTPHLFGTQEQDVYLPLRVGPQGNEAAHYVLVIVPGVDLDELFITITALGEDGSPRAFLKQHVPLNFGYYPAEQPVRIPIPVSEAGPAAFYFVRLGAQLTGGGTATTELWFAHAAS